MSCNTVPLIKFIPASLGFTIEEGDPTTHSLALRIENEGGASRDLEWDLSCLSTWLSFVPDKGVNTKIIVVQVSGKYMAPDSYKDRIKITALDSPNSPQYVPVSLVIIPVMTTVTGTSDVTVSPESSTASPESTTLPITPEIITEPIPVPASTGSIIPDISDEEKISIFNFIWSLIKKLLKP